MPTFSIEKRVSACFIDKALLRSVEDYVKRRVAELPKNPNMSDTAYGYSVAITDEVGTEQLQSIDQFGPARFYDGTQQIKIEYRGYHPKLLSLRIVFSKARYNSSIDASYEADAAREFVIGFVDGLERTMEGSRTSHSWLHPPSSLKGMVFGVAMGLPGLALFTMFAPIPGLRKVTSVIIALLIAIIGYSILGTIKPYSTFDTRRNDRLARLSSWVIGGFATFLVFTLLADYVRKWAGF